MQVLTKIKKPTIEYAEKEGKRGGFSLGFSAFLPSPPQPSYFCVCFVFCNASYCYFMFLIFMFGVFLMEINVELKLELGKTDSFSGRSEDRSYILLY